MSGTLLAFDALLARLSATRGVGRMIVAGVFVRLAHAGADITDALSASAIDSCITRYAAAPCAAMRAVGLSFISNCAVPAIRPMSTPIFQAVS